MVSIDSAPEWLKRFRGTLDAEGLGQLPLRRHQVRHLLADADREAGRDQLVCGVLQRGQ